VFGLLQSCSNETRERPPALARHPTAASDRGAALARPLPDTAFQEPGGAPEDLSSSHPEAFRTRTIGGAPDGDGPARFHGARVDLDLKDTDVHDVFRLLADVGKVNIVVGGEVAGRVTLRLRHVQWDQALDVIVRARGLVVEREGNIILIRGGGAR
jgi:hypothetical protein